MAERRDLVSDVVPNVERLLAGHVTNCPRGYDGGPQRSGVAASWRGISRLRKSLIGSSGDWIPPHQGTQPAATTPHPPGWVREPTLPDLIEDAFQVGQCVLQQGQTDERETSHS